MQDSGLHSARPIMKKSESPAKQYENQFHLRRQEAGETGYLQIKESMQLMWQVILTFG